MERLGNELAPLGVRLEIAQDTSPFIEQSVHEVQFHLLFGGGLAILIVLLFSWLFYQALQSMGTGDKQ